MSKYSLLGVDGNAFSVMGYVTKAMKREDKSEDEVKAFRDKAQSGDYNNLLSVSQKMVEKLNDPST